MPSRFVSLVILIYWSIAAFCLLTWDVIPELALGISSRFASDRPCRRFDRRPVRWSIQVIDDPRFPDVRRMVGEAVTASSRRPDGWFELTSRVELDAGGLLKGTPFLTRSSVRLEVESRYLVEPSGNLHSFDSRRQIARVARDADQGQGPDQGKEDGDCLPRPGADAEQETGVRLRAAERGARRAGPARSASRPARGPAVGVAGGQSVYRAGRSPVRVEVARRRLDQLERQPGDHLRGRAAHGARCRCGRGSVSTGSSSARRCRSHSCGWCSSAGRSRTTSRHHTRPGCQPHDRSVRRDQAVWNQVRRRPARPGGPARRAVRVSRAQRRGQDDHDQDDLRAAGSDRGHASGSVVSTHRASRHANSWATSPISRIFTTS